MRDLFWIPRSVEIAKSIRAEAVTTPAEPDAPAAPPPQAPEHKGGDEQVARIRELRSKMMSGEDPFAGAVQEGDEGPTIEDVPEELRGAIVETDEQESLPGDPPDTYRDSNGRLRDVATKRFLAEPTDEEKAAAAAARGELEGGVTDTEGEPGAGADLVFEFARPGRDPLKLPVPDQATLDTLKHLQNGYMKGEEIRSSRSQIESAQAELREIGEAMESDPIGYILGQLPEQSHHEVALAILKELPQQSFEAVLNQVREWEDEPIMRREQALESREQRAARQREAEQSRSQRAAQTQHVQAIGEAIENLIPESAPDTDADEFYEHALMKLRTWIRTERRYPDPAEVPELIRGFGLVRRYGFDGKPAAPSDTRKAGPATPAPASKKAAAVDEGAIQRARKLPEELRKRTEQRKAAAAIAPGGAGAGTGRQPAFEPGQHIRDRLRAARSKFLGRS